MSPILIIDNYDSFTYNLVHMVNHITGGEADVYRNDEITLDKVGRYEKIILSPGPGLPKESGILLPLIQQYAPHKQILGVCIGHQAIGEAFGGSLVNLNTVYHGVATTLTVQDQHEPLFKNLPESYRVGRYHSWMVNEEDLPDSLHITATDEEGRIMALRHKEYPLCGVQFHPESVLTEYGKELMTNWLWS